MTASEVSNVRLTAIGSVTGTTKKGNPISVVHLEYRDIPIVITLKQRSDGGTNLRVELDDDALTLRLQPGTVELGAPFDGLELQASTDEPSAAHLVVGTDSNYEAGMIAGILESDQFTDSVVAQLIRAAAGEIEVYRELLDVADDEIAWCEHWAMHADEAIATLIKYVGKLERRVKKLKRQLKEAHDKGFEAALALAPGEGPDAPSREAKLVDGSQDPEFAAARNEHEA